MLRFINRCDEIDCEREDSSSAAFLYLAGCGKYLTRDVDLFATPDELRQIADKLEELNGK